MQAGIQDYITEQRKSLSKNIYLFAGTSLMLLLVALADGTVETIATAALYLAILWILVLNAVGLFRFFYGLDMAGEGLLEKTARRKLIGGRVLFGTGWLVIAGGLIYVILLVFCLVCDRDVMFNRTLINEIGGMTESSREYGMAVLKVLLQTVAMVLVLYLSCCVSYSSLFKGYRILAAIFMFIVILSVGRYSVFALSRIVISALGGIEAMFAENAHSAVLITLSLESAWLALGILGMLYLIDRYAAGRKEVVGKG